MPPQWWTGSFDEAERRDPEHRRTWIALIDGNNHQIDRITAEARRPDVAVPIVVDLVHVLEYLWKAAWSFHTEADPAAELWVHNEALAVLAGEAAQVATSIRRSASRRGLLPFQREGADRAADYLTANTPTSTTRPPSRVAGRSPQASSKVPVATLSRTAWT